MEQEMDNSSLLFENNDNNRITTNEHTNTVKKWTKKSLFRLRSSSFHHHESFDNGNYRFQRTTTSSLKDGTFPLFRRFYLTHSSLKRTRRHLN
ncbi:unnamed protein product, partial [Didymodactylos carnosus]